MIKVGLVMDWRHIYNGGPAKYAGVSLLLKAMVNDNRYEPYLVYTKETYGTHKEGRYNQPYIDKMVDLGCKLVSFEDANENGLVDYFILTCPYRTLYKNLKKPYIYCEYGLDSISEDISQVTTYGKIYKNAHTILVSTNEKMLQLKYDIGVQGNIIMRKPSYDYPLLSEPIINEEYFGTVMYAPHHTIDKDNPAADNKRYSCWNNFKGQFINLVKDNPDIKFYYKPHPRLDYTAGKSHLDYKEELSKYPNVEILGGDIDYYPYFLGTDILMTDCISFIGEWMVARKPLIRIKDEDTSIYSESTEKMIEECYANYDITINPPSAIQSILRNMISSMRNPEITKNIDYSKFNKYLEKVTYRDISNCQYIMDRFYELIN